MARSQISGWTVAVGLPVAEVEGTARKAAIFVGLGFFLASFAALGGAFFFGRRVAGSIRSVAQSAELLGEGKLPVEENHAVAEINIVQKSLINAGEVIQLKEKQRNDLMAEAISAKAVAEQQNRAKDEFLAMLGHELRNPLAALTSGITLLKQKNVPETVKQRAQDIIDRQAKHLSTIVDELLDSQRILAGKVVLQKACIDLAQAVGECLDAYEAQGKSSGYTVNLSVETAFIDADATRLHQMICNLLDNAFKYTPAGGTIDISVSRQGDHVFLRVADTGIGISATVLPTIFDVFVQGPVSNRSKGGLGVGLAVVRALAQQHGGAIKAESRGADQGSVFTLSFPLSHNVLQPALTQTTEAPPSQLIILVVEDNADARIALCDLLTSQGFSVISAGNGLEGVQRAREHIPDVALIDIDLPDILGYEVVSRLKNNDLTAKIKLIAVTGYGQEADRQKALASGFDHHMRKPLNMDELFAALNSSCSSVHCAAP